MLGPANERNAFLSQLSSADYAALRGYLAPMELRVGQYLHCRTEAIDQVIFPHSGLVAMSIPLRGYPGAAAALIGRDGIVGALAALAGAPAGYDAKVHIAGYASQLPAAAFRQLLDENPSLARHVVRYSQALLVQSQLNAVCHAAHPVEARMCRWLLAIQARCGGDKVRLIQDTLAQMLGVRRTTVTMVAGGLEALGVIKCHRGCIHILSQDELEQHSCECHAMLDDYASKLLSTSAEAAPLAELSGAEPQLFRRNATEHLLTAGVE